MKWLRCRVCQRTAPLSRAARWVEEWSSGHVRWLCPHCRAAGEAQAAQDGPASASSAASSARREYFVDPHGLMRTRRVIP